MAREVNLQDDENMTVTLEFDDGTEQECIALDVFSIEELGDQEYIALLALPENGDFEDDVEGEILLYRYEEVGEDDINLIAIEDDEEAEMVEAAYQSLLDEEEEE